MTNRTLCKPDFRQYKWLDLCKLCEQFLMPQDVLTDILYFTALPTWNKDKRQNHKTYLEAVEAEGVTVILGKFKEVTRHCLLGCNGKRRNAFTNTFDKVVLVSGDSDLLPPIRRVRLLFPEKITGCVVPGKGYDMLNNCHLKYRLKERHLKNAIFFRSRPLGLRSIVGVN